MRVVICDRCNKQIKTEEALRVSTSIISGNSIFMPNVASDVKEVCEGCYNKIEEFINNKPVLKSKQDKAIELKELAKPLVDLLYRDYNPHTTIILTQVGTEVAQGVISTPNELRD